MDYIEKFKRADIQHLREFLANGVECVEIDPRSYRERIEAPRKCFLDALRKAFPDENAYEEMTSKLYGFVARLKRFIWKSAYRPDLG